MFGFSMDEILSQSLNPGFYSPTVHPTTIQAPTDEQLQPDETNTLNSKMCVTRATDLSSSTVYTSVLRSSFCDTTSLCQGLSWLLSDVCLHAQFPRWMIKSLRQPAATHSWHLRAKRCGGKSLLDTQGVSKVALMLRSSGVRMTEQTSPVHTRSKSKDFFVQAMK